MATEINDLEAAAKQLREGLKDVDENIKKLTGRDPSEPRPPGGPRRVQLKRSSFQSAPSGLDIKRRLSEGGAARRWGRTVSDFRTTINEATALDSSGEEDSNVTKSSIRSSVIATKIPADIPPPKKEAVRDDKQAKSRNKRMFGLLMGTLQQFKEDTKTRADKEQKRVEIEKKLEEKAAQEKEQVASQRRELYQTRRQKQLELKRLELKMNVAELKTEIGAHYEHLGNHIRLKSTPSVFYLPAVHTDATRKLLEESKKTMTKIMTTRLSEMDKTCEAPAVEEGNAVSNERIITTQGDVDKPTSVKMRLDARLRGIADNYGNEDAPESVDPVNTNAEKSPPHDVQMADSPPKDSPEIDPMPSIVAADYANDSDAGMSTNERRVVVKSEGEEQEEGEIN